MHLLVKIKLELYYKVTALKTFLIKINKLVNAASYIKKNVCIKQKEVEAKKQLKTNKRILQALNSS